MAALPKITLLAGLVLLATLCLLGSLGAAAYLQRWRDRHPLREGEALARREPPPDPGLSEMERGVSAP